MLAPETNKPAINTPMLINASARRKGMSNKYAASAPLHPPVIGKGIATKTIKASAPHLISASLSFFLVLANKKLKNRSKKENREIKKPETGLINNRTMATAEMLPPTDQKNALKGDIL